MVKQVSIIVILGKLNSFNFVGLIILRHHFLQHLDLLLGHFVGLSLVDVLFFLRFLLFLFWLLDFFLIFNVFFFPIFFILKYQVLFFLQHFRMFLVIH